MQLIKNILSETRAATAIEYAFVGSLIAVAAVAAFTLLGDTVENSYSDTAQQVEDAHNAASGN